MAAPTSRTARCRRSRRARSSGSPAARALARASRRARTYAPPLTSPWTGSPSSHSVASELVTSSRSTCSPSHSAGTRRLDRQPPRRPQRPERHPQPRVAVVQRGRLGGRDPVRRARRSACGRAPARRRARAPWRGARPGARARACSRGGRAGPACCHVESSRSAPTSRERHRLRKGADQMQIRARMSMSADGFVTTPSGWPALTADPAFVSGESHGIREFLDGCEAALMGRTTFEPALEQRPLAVADPERVRARLTAPGRDARPRGRRRRPGAAAGEDPRRQPGPRRPSRRRPAHDRDLPRPRSARQARAGRAAAAPRRRDAADAVAQPRHGDDVRARARPPGRLGGDRLRRQRARGDLPGREAGWSPASQRRA